MRPTYTQIYMEMAERFAERSKCKRLQVGCVITSSDFRQVLSNGYNGDASAQNNGCSGQENFCGDLHAEQNAMLSSDCNRKEPKYVFSTTLPCLMCAKALVNFGGVKRVYYNNEYRNKDALKIFKKAKIKVIKLNVSKRTNWDLITYIWSMFYASIKS